MKPQALQIDQLLTERLILIPFTTKICENLMREDYSDLEKRNLKKGKSWPDADVLETLPKIIANLAQVASPTGFESWIIIKKDNLEIIGDAGFKGFNTLLKSADIGYGIIAEERKKGFAREAAEALIKWAFATGIVKEITASCLMENQFSINLLQKLNFVTTKTDDTMLYWFLQNKEYQNNRT